MSLRVLLCNVPLEDSLQKAWFPCWKSRCLDPEFSDLNNDWISWIQEVGPPWRKWVTGVCLKDLPCPSFCFSELCSTRPPAEISTLLWSSTTGSANHGVRLLSWEPASVFPPSSCFGWGVSTQWLKLTHLARSGPLTESAHKIHMKDPLRFLFSLTWMSRTL